MDETRLLELTAQAGEYALKYYKPRGPLAYAFRNLRDARFAALIRAEVLEEAARICETIGKDIVCPEECAFAIRAAKEGS